MFSTPPDADAHTASAVAGLRQRAITERLLLAALRAQDATRRALEAERRAEFLLSAGRELAAIRDQEAIRGIVQRSTLPRAGSWCIVDVIESNGTVVRLPVVHPDPVMQGLARGLDWQWHVIAARERFDAALAIPHGRDPQVITPRSGAALLAAVHGAANLEILRAIGFGELLVIPLVVRDTALGAITFVTREDDPPLAAEDVACAASYTDRCAIALENARLYAEAITLRADADAANRAKSTFLGGISHDLLTPLNAIGGYAQLLETEVRGPVSPEQRADLQRITRSQRHLVTLIKGILEYVHADAGGIVYHPTHVAVQELLLETAEMLAAAAAQKQLTIEVEAGGGGGGATVWADQVRVRQILVNLATNAVKYTAAGGGNIALGFAERPDVVDIHVIDAGPGIPAEQLDAIFDPFVQVGSELTDRQGGVGLGLAISRDLATAMRGQLTVRSSVGVGSRFTLTLPRSRAGA